MREKKGLWSAPTLTPTLNPTPIPNLSQTPTSSSTPKPQSSEDSLLFAIMIAFAFALIGAIAVLLKKWREKRLNI